MLFRDLLPPTPATHLITEVIKAECSQFLHESAGQPVYKALPTSYGLFKRVKVRFQKQKDSTSSVFEQAFGDNPNVGFRERAVITHPQCVELTEGQDMYYVFPTNGYKFLFSPTISNSKNDVGGVVNTLIESLDEDEANNIAVDLLKYSYQSTNLHEGINRNSEIIFYDIPNFIAVHTSLASYNILIT